MLVGGRRDQVERARSEARQAGVDAVTVFAGEQPAESIPDYLAAADVLVSPRSRGKNTPLKIYQYFRAGRPIVATDLLTHTQVLDPTVACLAGATPELFAGGILRVIGDAPYAQSLATEAARLAATRYTYDAYLARTRTALDCWARPVWQGAPPHDRCSPRSPRL